MVNYNNGKIYKIECLNDDCNEIYIGSTTKDYLSKRMTMHREQYKQYKKGKKLGNVSVYNIFDKYGLENCIITLIENVEAKTKDELLMRESYYIKSMVCVNKKLPKRTIEDVKEYRKQYAKEYYNKNQEYREKRLDQMKEYNNKNI